MARRRTTSTTQQCRPRRALVLLAVPLLATLAGCDDGTGTATTATTADRPTTTGGVTPDGFDDTVPTVDSARLDCAGTDEDAGDALDRATRFLQAQRTPRVDATWVLARLGVADPLAGRSLGEPSDPARRLLEPRAVVEVAEPAADADARTRLGADIDVVFAPVSAATDAAFTDYVTRPGLTGYALTHQWLAVIWAGEIGRPLPPGVEAAAADLPGRVRAEVGAPGETQDLFAERAALVAAFAPSLVDATTAAAWRCRAVATQEPLGYWRTDGTYEQAYEGETFDVVGQPEHVTSLMALLLDGLAG